MALTMASIEVSRRYGPLVGAGVEKLPISRRARIDEIVGKFYDETDVDGERCMTLDADVYELAQRLIREHGAPIPRRGFVATPENILGLAQLEVQAVIGIAAVLVEEQETDQKKWRGKQLTDEQLKPRLLKAMEEAYEGMIKLHHCHRKKADTGFNR